MAGEKPSGSQPADPSGGNANKGPNRNNNRRRSLRSKRRGGRKPEEGGEARDPREAREPREARPQPSAPKVVEKSVRDNRERRRRRRMRAKQRGPNENTTPVVDDALKDLPPLVPSFVYTHLIRPSVRDSFEFRSEHFSKVTRKLEDFHIDLSPLYPDGGDEIKGVAYISEAERAAFDYDDDDEEGDAVIEPENAGAGDVASNDQSVEQSDDQSDNNVEGFEDPDWDAEQIAEAAHLDGAIADDFFEDLDDSVLDDSPDEDIDR